MALTFHTVLVLPVGRVTESFNRIPLYSTMVERLPYGCLRILTFLFVWFGNMRLHKFLINTDESGIFRSLKLELVEEETGNTAIVRRISEQYLDDSALILLEKANAELKKMYRGKLRFDFCLDEQGMSPDEVRIDSTKAKRLKDRWFKLNDELSEIQNRFEIKLKESLHK